MIDKTGESTHTPLSLGMAPEGTVCERVGESEGMHHDGQPKLSTPDTLRDIFSNHGYKQ